MSRSFSHPYHDRASCSDTQLINADPSGSTGCARCTAILLDQRDSLLIAASGAVRKLTAATKSHPKAVQHLIGEALERLTDAINAAGGSEL